uniref:Putative glutamic acid-rich protein n=1 Tax=Toxoplasma gondii COUG TaxID=1074873 RepID=A0A2G8XYY9_TOXGO|nr:putative glutamic acid-rich protein [Toxoplasma gondii COUG]
MATDDTRLPRQTMESTERRQISTRNSPEMKTSRSGSRTDGAAQPPKVTSPFLAVRVLRCEGLKHSGMHAVEVEVGGHRRVSGWIEGFHDATFNFSSTFNKVPRDGNVRLSVWHKRSWREDKRVCDTYYSIGSLFSAPAHAYRGWLGLEQNTRFAGQVLVEFSLLSRGTSENQREAARLAASELEVKAESGRSQATERPSGEKTGEEREGKEEQSLIGDRGRESGERESGDDVDKRAATAASPCGRHRLPDHAYPVKRSSQQAPEKEKSSDVVAFSSSPPSPVLPSGPSSGVTSSSTSLQKTASSAAGEKRNDEATRKTDERGGADSRDADLSSPAALGSPVSGLLVDLLSLDVEIHGSTEKKRTETEGSPSLCFSGVPAGLPVPQPRQELHYPGVVCSGVVQQGNKQRCVSSVSSYAEGDGGEAADMRPTEAQGEATRTTERQEEFESLPSERKHRDRKQATCEQSLVSRQHAANKPPEEGGSALRLSMASPTRHWGEEEMSKEEEITKNRENESATDSEKERAQDRDEANTRASEEEGVRRQATQQGSAGECAERETWNLERRERNPSRERTREQRAMTAQRGRGKEGGESRCQRRNSGDENSRDLRGTHQEIRLQNAGPELRPVLPGEKTEKDRGDPRAQEGKKQTTEAEAIAGKHAEADGENCSRFRNQGRSIFPPESEISSPSPPVKSPRIESAPVSSVSTSRASASSPNASFSSESQRQFMTASPSCCQEAKRDKTPIESLSSSSPSSSSTPSSSSSSSSSSSVALLAHASGAAGGAASPALHAALEDAGKRERDWRALDEIFFAESSRLRRVSREGWQPFLRAEGDAKRVGDSASFVDVQAANDAGGETTKGESRAEKEEALFPIVAEHRDIEDEAWRDAGVKGDEGRTRGHAGCNREGEMGISKKETETVSPRGRSTHEASEPLDVSLTRRRRFSVTSEGCIEAGSFPEGADGASTEAHARRSSHSRCVDFGRGTERDSGFRKRETSDLDQSRLDSGCCSAELPPAAFETDAFRAPLFPAHKETVAPSRQQSPPGDKSAVRVAPPIFPADEPTPGPKDEENEKLASVLASSLCSFQGGPGTRVSGDRPWPTRVEEAKVFFEREENEDRRRENGTVGARDSLFAAIEEKQTTAANRASEEEKKQFHREALAEYRRKTREATKAFGPLHAYSPWGGVGAFPSPRPQRPETAPVDASAEPRQSVSESSPAISERRSSGSWFSAFPVVSWYPVMPPEQTSPPGGRGPREEGTNKETKGRELPADSGWGDPRAPGEDRADLASPPFPSSSCSFDDLKLAERPPEVSPEKKKPFSRLRFHLGWPHLKSSGKTEKRKSEKKAETEVSEPQSTAEVGVSISPRKKAPRDAEPGAAGRPREKRRSVSSSSRRSTVSAPSWSLPSSPSFPTERDADAPPFPLADRPRTHSGASLRSRSSSRSSSERRFQVSARSRPAPPPLPVLPPPPLDVGDLDAGADPEGHLSSPSFLSSLRQNSVAASAAGDVDRSSREQRKASVSRQNVEFPQVPPWAKEEERAFIRLGSETVSADAPRLAPPPGDVVVELPRHREEEAKHLVKIGEGDQRTLVKKTKKGSRKVHNSKKTRQASSSSPSQGEETFFPDAPTADSPFPLEPSLFLEASGWTENAPPLALSSAVSSFLSPLPGSQPPDVSPRPRDAEGSAVPATPAFLACEPERPRYAERGNFFFSTPPRTPSLAMPCRPPEHALPDREPLPPLSPETRRRCHRRGAGESEMEAGEKDQTLHATRVGKMKVGRDVRPLGLPGGPYEDRRESKEPARRSTAEVRRFSSGKRRQSGVKTAVPSADITGGKVGGRAHAMHAGVSGIASFSYPRSSDLPASTLSPPGGYPGAVSSPFGSGSPPGPASSSASSLQCLMARGFSPFDTLAPEASSPSPCCPPAYPVLATPLPSAPVALAAHPFCSSLSSPCSPFASASPYLASAQNPAFQVWRENAVECRNSAVVAPQIQVQRLAPLDGREAKNASLSSGSPFATSVSAPPLPSSATLAGGQGTERSYHRPEAQNRNPFSALADSTPVSAAPLSSASAPVSSLPFSPSTSPSKLLPIVVPPPSSPASSFVSAVSSGLSAESLSHSPFAVSVPMLSGVHAPGTKLPVGSLNHRRSASESDRDVDRNPFALLGSGTKRDSLSAMKTPTSSLSVARASHAPQTTAVRNSSSGVCVTASPLVSLQGLQGGPPPSGPSSSSGANCSASVSSVSPFALSRRAQGAGAGDGLHWKGSQALLCDRPEETGDSREAEKPRHGARERRAGSFSGDTRTPKERKGSVDARESGAEERPTRGRQRQRTVSDGQTGRGDGVASPAIQAPRFPSPTPH